MEALEEGVLERPPQFEVVRPIELDLHAQASARVAMEQAVARFVTMAADRMAMKAFFDAFELAAKDWPKELRDRERQKLKRVFRLEGESILDPSMLESSIFSQGAKSALKTLSFHQVIRRYDWLEPDFPEQLSLSLW